MSETSTFLACPFRARVREENGKQLAVCELVSRATGLPDACCEAVEEACRTCCSSPWPSTSPRNPVIASLICDAADKAQHQGIAPVSGGASASSLAKIGRTRLELLSRSPDTSVFPARYASCNCYYLGAPKPLSATEPTYDCEHGDHAQTSLSQCQTCRDWTLQPVPERLRLPRMIPLPAAQSGPRVREWAIGMTTAPRAQATLAMCIESVTRAGWNDLHLFVDAGAKLPDSCRHYPVTRRDHRVGAWPNFYLALHEMMLRQPNADAYMLLQDDAYFYDLENVRAYLEAVLWPGPEPGLVSLYSTDANSFREPGWHEDPHRWMSGALAFVFPRSILRRFLLDHHVFDYRRQDFGGGKTDLDLLVGEWAEASDVPVWYPMPSLVQHVGNVSSIWTGANNGGLRRSSWFAGDIEAPFDTHSSMHGFHESQFPPSGSEHRAYRERVEAGREKMKQSRVVICGLARDVRHHLPRTIARLEWTGGMFAEYGVVICENDSRDGTAEHLRRWEQQNHRVHTFTDELGLPKYGQVRSLSRASQLAHCRNRYLSYALATYSQYDYLIVVDTDLRGGWSYDGLAHTFGQHDWDFVGSNGLELRVVPTRPPRPEWIHFDSWAFRGWDAHVDERGSAVVPRDDAYRVAFRRGDPLVRVSSCFGGLGVYRLEALVGASYDGSDCEHVGLHRRMAAAGHQRLFLNPSQITVY